MAVNVVIPRLDVLFNDDTYNIGGLAGSREDEREGIARSQPPRNEIYCRLTITSLKLFAKKLLRFSLIISLER